MYLAWPKAVRLGAALNRKQRRRAQVYRARMILDAAVKFHYQGKGSEEEVEKNDMETEGGGESRLLPSNGLRG